MLQSALMTLMLALGPGRFCFSTRGFLSLTPKPQVYPKKLRSNASRTSVSYLIDVCTCAKDAFDRHKPLDDTYWWDLARHFFFSSSGWETNWAFDLICNAVHGETLIFAVE